MDKLARPAESWRRTARLGATVCCLATLIPTYGGIGSQWDMGIQSILDASWSHIYQSAPGPKPLFVPAVAIITSFYQAALAAPVFFLFATGPWMTCISNTINVSKLVLFAQLAFFAFIPACTLLRLLPDPRNKWLFAEQGLENSTILALGLATFTLYLMLVGLSVLLWRDKRNTAWELLPLAAVPFLFCVLRWVCMFAISTQRGQPAIFPLTATIYLLGATLLCLGWVQATRTLARAQLTTSPVASAPESHSTR